MRDPRGSIATFTGRLFWPLDPDPLDVDIRDIAHALSQLCRFTGHTRSFYSIAQHSALVSDSCAPAHQLWGLLHDAAEAYLHDVPAPVKAAADLDFYRQAESRVQAAIEVRYGLLGPMPAEIKVLDEVFLNVEKRDFMNSDDWRRDLARGVTRIEPADPAVAEAMFLLRFDALVPEGRR